MSEAGLQEYLQEINRLIEDSHLTEAVGHCRHILSQFPRHLDTYRLMGKALLEQGELEGAADVFQRVLSCDPEDFIAHAGIAIIYKQENRLREAAWHMERAFEVEPYNRAIREALQDLIGRRDGMPPERLALTRGALARLYVRGELYAHAVSDLRQLVSEEPERVDLHVLLAEARWRDGQRIEAADDCTRLLERLPDCMKANAILAEVALVTDRVDEAQKYLRRVFELALPTTASLGEDSAVGIAFGTKGSPPLPPKIMVSRAAGELSGESAGDAGSWINDLDLGEELVLEDVEPDWLGELQDKVEPPGGDNAALATEFEQKATEVTSDITGNEGEGTSWFSRSSDQLPGIGELREETDWEAWLEHEREQRVPVDPDSRDISSEVEEVGMGTMDEPGKNQEEFPEADEPQRPDSESFGAEDDSLDWLDDLQEAAGPAEASDEDELEGLETGDLPDWLREGVDMDDVAAGELDWLDDSAEGQGAGEEENVAQGDVLPDWLREDIALEDEAGKTEAADDLSWLDQIASGEGAPLEEPPTLSWPESDLSEQESSEDPRDASFERDVESAFGDAGESFGDASDVAGGHDLSPESVSDDDPYGDVPEDLDEAMAWLERLASQQGAPDDELPSLREESPRQEGPVAEEAPDEIGEAMDWLDELARAEDDAGLEPLALADAEDADEFDDTDDATWLDDFGDLGDIGVGESAFAEEQRDVELESGIGRAVSDDDVFEQQSGPALAGEQEDEPAEAVPKEHDEAMAWLEQLTSQEEVAVDDSAPLRQEPVAESDDALLGGDAWLQEPELDEAMAWLEQLATEDEPGDDYTSWEGLEDMSDTEALEGLDDIPDDPELALAWLEGLADRPAAAPIDEDEPRVVEEEATPPVPHDVVAARAEAEAMLLHERPSAEEETDDSGMLEDIPDDPDEAMAWLEKLAARQGAPRDELPSLADDDSWDDDILIEEDILLDEDVSWDDVTADETPSWLDDELPLADLEQDVELPAIEEDIEEPEQVDHSAVEALEMARAFQESDEGEEPVGEHHEEPAPIAELGFGDEELEEDLPDWLALDDEDDANDFDWEEPAFDPTGWLAAEESAVIGEAQEDEAFADEAPEAQELATIASGEDETPALETSELEQRAAEAPVTSDEEVHEEELDIPGETEEVIEPIVSDFEDADHELEVETADWSDELNTAQQALEVGHVDKALERYQTYLEHGDDISTLIADLERATQEYQNQPALTQLLGDAYNKNGQLQKALDAYRQALAML